MPTPTAPRRCRLGFESLEDRSLPTAFGIPWADPGHLTLSFPADGTPTPTAANSLSMTMAPAGATAAWQREILRAFQTWAVNANINIGLVKDGNQPTGGQGAVQGDSRYGDIRLTAAPVSSDEVAAGSPFTWTGTTFAGDVTFGNAAPYRIGNVAGAYDVFSVAVHEAGHVFGLDHSTEAGSVMNEGYAYHTGLSAGDVANIRALYGARAPDAYDAVSSNDTMSRATPLPAVGGSQRAAVGDISSLSDVDFYKFSTGLGTLSVTVRLHASGYSLLAPSVTVYNSSGRVVASAKSTDPLHNDLSVSFIPALLGGTYYVKVDGATSDAFGMGGYELVEDNLSLGSVLGLVPALLSPILDLGTNDSLLTATLLGSGSGGAKTDGRFDANYRGVVESASDVDDYRIRAPGVTNSAPLTLNAVVWGLDANPVNPRLRVYNALGAPVAFQVLADDTGIMSVQVPDATPGATYYVQVSARDPGGANDTGAYLLGLDFNQSTPTTYTGVAADSLAPTQTTDTASLAVTTGAIYQFDLTSQLLSSGAAGVTMTVLDGKGNAVLSLSGTAGQPAVTRVQYLPAGNYAVRYTYKSPSSGTAGSVKYNLYLLLLSDGVGPYATTTSTDAGPPPPDSSSSGGYTYTGSSTGTPDSYGYYF